MLIAETSFNVDMLQSDNLSYNMNNKGNIE